MQPPKTRSIARYTMILTTYLVTLAFGLACSACASDSPTSTRAVIEAQGAILDAGPLVCPSGADVLPHDQPATFRFSGRVYILPEETYRALMLTD